MSSARSRESGSSTSEGYGACFHGSPSWCPWPSSRSSARSWRRASQSPALVFWPAGCCLTENEARSREREDAAVTGRETPASNHGRTGRLRGGRPLMSPVATALCAQPEEEALFLVAGLGAAPIIQRIEIPARGSDGIGLSVAD